MASNFLRSSLFLCLVLNFLNAAERKDDKEYTLADFLAEGDNKSLFLKDLNCAVLTGFVAGIMSLSYPRVDFFIDATHLFRRMLLNSNHPYDSQWALGEKFKTFDRPEDVDLADLEKQKEGIAVWYKREAFGRNEKYSFSIFALYEKNETYVANRYS